MRNEIGEALIASLKARDKLKASTLRLVSAAIKDRDIEARGKGKEQISDEEILSLLQKMVKQREESAKIYRENNRAEMADQEEAEIAIITGFLPQSLSDAEVDAAIAAAISQAGAESMKDMGKVVGVLKGKYPGQLDFGKVAGLVKAKLS